jgi:putative transposase
VSEVVRYTYRLRPGAMAERALISEWHRCRWLWNEAVHQYRSGNKPTICKLSKLLTAARAVNPWLREGSQVAQQQMLRTYMRALDDSFKVKGRGRPASKRRKTALPSLEYTVNGFSVKGGHLILPKGVSIPVVWSRDLPGVPRSVRVYQDNLGHWYASFVVIREVIPAEPAIGAVGVDGGVKATGTTTDPAFDFPHVGHRKRCAAQVACAQRNCPAASGSKAGNSTDPSRTATTGRSGKAPKRRRRRREPASTTGASGPGRSWPTMT